MITQSQQTVTLTGGATAHFALRKDHAEKAFFVLGIRKCGSSIMNSMLTDLAKLNSVQFVDVGGVFFAANIPEHVWRVDPAVRALLAPGNLYGGFRAMPLVFDKMAIYQKAPKILLVRDPRDALVSEYFSIAFSHALPNASPADEGARSEFLSLRGQALSSQIEEIVVDRAEALCNTFLEYEAARNDPLCKLYRYENVIMKKPAWLRSMAAHFGWQPGSQAFIDGMMSWADVVPDEEKSQNFIRKVVPGDHRAKLSPVVIAKLNEILRPAMELFDYAPDFR